MTTKQLTSVFFFVCLALGAKSQDTSQLNFVEVKKKFPTYPKNLRKWDAPTIVDLDQDGFNDLLLNDHGFSTQVMWNNAGKFSKPFDIIMGDIHGITAGHLDSDSALELVFSRGGGSGSNARNSKLYKIGKDRNFLPQGDFDVPLELMRGRTVVFFDGDNDGDLDLLNFAFPDKAKNGASENYIYENNGTGQLILNNSLPPVKMNGQKTQILDFNQDGVTDILLYGDGPIKLFQGNGDLHFKEVTQEILPASITDVNMTYAFDYDNDGDEDIFFARGNEFVSGETFFDSAQGGTLGFYTKRGPFELIVETGDILNLVNLQSQWPNKAIYLGESAYNYEFPGETHSGRNVRLVNSDCLGFPDLMDKKGTYIGYIGNRRWKIAGNMWPPMTGTITQVKNYQKTHHPAKLANILLENDNGFFKDVSKQAGFTQLSNTASVTVADFDNNGYQDLVLTPRGNIVKGIDPVLFLNSGEKTFTKAKILSTPEKGAIGMCSETFDYNNDGLVDLVIGNERGKWHLFQNKSYNTNHYLTARIGLSPKKKATNIGAKVALYYQGKLFQTKWLGANSSSYSQGLNKDIHLGLGDKAKNLELSVTWTNGENQKVTVKNIEQVLSIGHSTLPQK